MKTKYYVIIVKQPLEITNGYTQGYFLNTYRVNKGLYVAFDELDHITDVSKIKKFKTREGALQYIDKLERTTFGGDYIVTYTFELGELNIFKEHNDGTNITLPRDVNNAIKKDIINLLYDEIESYKPKAINRCNDEAYKDLILQQIDSYMYKMIKSLGKIDVDK